MCAIYLSSSMSSRSPVPVWPAADSSYQTCPSSAGTSSDSTIQSVGAINAETSDKDSSSFTIEFKDSQRYMYKYVYISFFTVLECFKHQHLHSML